MRLSFVIPAYNEEAYLEACVASIRKQTRLLDIETEIIVVDNASTDGTHALALSMPDVTLVYEPRKGLTFARQAGFDASTGELIANVDSDSRLTDGWVQQVLNTFASSPGLVALSGPVVYYDLTARELLLVRVFYTWAWVVYAVNRWVLRVGSMVQGGNFVITREALDQIGGFNLAITFYGEDTDIARRLHEVGKVRFTFNLKMFSSARRLRKEGMFATAARYTANYFWMTFLERPFTNEHADIRDQA
jgi:glycosyltransferase involved in cell wall biosynthesis